MKALRRALFWTHLAAGSLAGSVIFVLCVTGVLLAFQPQVLRFVERDARRTPASSGERLAAGTLLRLAAEASPGAAPTAVTVTSDPADSAAVDFGRERTLFLDPVGGAVLGSSSSGLARVLRRRAGRPPMARVLRAEPAGRKGDHRRGESALPRSRALRPLHLVAEAARHPPRRAESVSSSAASPEKGATSTGTTSSACGPPFP